MHIINSNSDAVIAYNNTSECEPLISICIPSYNRGGTLEKTLDSLAKIIDKLEDVKLELVISDNKSTDNTVAVMEQFQNRYRHIQSVCVYNPENRGFDNNYLQTIRYAHGKYVWVIGDDDITNVDSVKKILIECQTAHEYIVFDGAAINGDSLEFRMKDRFITMGGGNNNRWEGDFDSFFELFGWHATWISVNVMSRSRLVACIDDVQPFIGQQFIHVALSALAFSRQRVSVINEAIIFDPPSNKAYTRSYKSLLTFFGTHLSWIVDRLVSLGKISMGSAQSFLLGHSRFHSMFGAKFSLNQVANGEPSRRFVIDNLHILRRVSVSPYSAIICLYVPEWLAKAMKTAHVFLKSRR